MTLPKHGFWMVHRSNQVGKTAEYLKQFLQWLDPNGTITVTTAKANELAAERDRLAAELAEVLEYAGHHDHCEWDTDHKGNNPCTCGWTAMRERHAKGRT